VNLSSKKYKVLMSWEGELTVFVVFLQDRGCGGYLELLYCPAEHIREDLLLRRVWLLQLLPARLIFAI
jgi:hypothetical protein